MTNPSKPTRQLDFTKVDVLAFQAMLEEHIRGVEQGFRDLTIAIGTAVGHVELSDALRARINDTTESRNTTAERLLDAAWRAASQRALWG